MNGPLERSWWEEDDRCDEWPADLIDHMHSSLVEGYNAGMIAAGHPELCKPVSA